MSNSEDEQTGNGEIERLNMGERVRVDRADRKERKKEGERKSGREEESACVCLQERERDFSCQRGLRLSHLHTFAGKKITVTYKVTLSKMYTYIKTLCSMGSCHL